MDIAQCRIDDRLIHGQIVTIWSQGCGCNKIIVVNDKAAEDYIKKTLLVQIAPPGLKAYVVGIKKALEAYKNKEYTDFNILLIVSNPADILSLVEGGMNIKSVNIGSMSFKEGKKQISSSVYVDEEDIEVFKKLNNKGIELEVRRVPTDIKVDLMTII